MAGKFAPTAEQVEALGAYLGGGTVVIVAGAGAGKTSTLELIAEKAAEQGKTVLYIAYNKSIADEAGRRFPSNTTCTTAHSIAFRAGGNYWAPRLRYPRQTAKDVARILGINEPVRLGSDLAPLSPQQVARLALKTVSGFCSTADAEIGEQHVPAQNGVDGDAHRSMAKAIVPLARKAWDDLRTKDGQLKYQHDYYFKRWQLSAPTLNYDVILLDECQDTDPVLADVFKRQADHAQLVLVGDRNQAIYGWRGCVDIMGDFPQAATVTLSKSFRFGPAVAGIANRFLALLDSELRMTGHDPIESVLGPVPTPDAIICRTNAGAVKALLGALEAGTKVAMVGGGQDIKRLAEAAQELQTRGYTGHPELAAFVSWQQVVTYVEDGDLGSDDLKVAVQLIEEHGADVVIAAIDGLAAERDADLVITTAHKSKGREWDRVRVAGDFKEPKGEVPAEELMLAYVTATRAKKALDLGGLSWVLTRTAGFGDTTPAQPVPTVVVEIPAPAVELPGPVAQAEARVKAARQPLDRAVALLELTQALAVAGQQGDDADRAEMVREIVAAYLGQDAKSALAEAV